MNRSVRMALWPVLLLMVICVSQGATDQLTPLQNCITSLAKKLNVAPDQVRIISVEGMIWPDASLGCPQPGQSYAQVATPGYEALLGVQEHRYEYHTDMGQRAVLASIDGVSVAGNNQVTNPQQQQSAPVVAATACRDDLAARLALNADQVTVTGITAVDFPDASLGLPRPGEAAAQVVTPGHIVILTGNNVGYLYTAAGKSCRFGGPVDARALSALYLEAVPNEANLNGNLMQISLAGACPTLVLPGVTDYRPQPNGSVIARRRTSRSGFDLLYLAPGATGDPVKIASAFDFGDAAVNADGTRWVAYVRARAGGAWQVGWGDVTAAKSNLLDDLLLALGGGSRVDLPAGATQGRLYWNLPNPVALVTEGADAVAYELPVTDKKPQWRKLAAFSAPPPQDFQLNKSETLLARTGAEQGKQVTRVIRKWFTGKETLVAVIADFKAEEMYVANQRFALLSGQRGGKNVGLTVDLASGVVLDTVRESSSPVRLLLAPPQGWLWSQLSASGQ